MNKILITILLTSLVVAGGFLFWMYKNGQITSVGKMSEENTTSTESLKNNESSDSKTTTKSATTQYESYTSLNSGITLQYSKTGYKVNESLPVQLTGTTGVQISILKSAEADAQTPDQVSGGINILTYDNVHQTSSLEWAKAELRTNFQQLGSKDYKIITVGGKSAVRFSSTNNQSTGVSDSIIIVHNGKGTTISLFYKDSSDPIRAEFSHLLDTLTFN